MEASPRFRVALEQLWLQSTSPLLMSRETLSLFPTKTLLLQWANNGFGGMAPRIHALTDGVYPTTIRIAEITEM